MPIPADNGNPEKERAAQDKRIEETAKTGADVQKEISFTMTKKADFGNIK
jgi:hypothetical protein